MCLNASLAFDDIRFVFMAFPSKPEALRPLARANDAQPRQERTRDVPPDIEQEVAREFKGAASRGYVEKLRPVVFELLTDHERHAERERSKRTSDVRLSVDVARPPRRLRKRG